MRKDLLLVFALAIAVPLTAWGNARRLGPFTLGQTVGEARAAAKRAGFAKARLQPPQERDLMGLGVMTVQPITFTSAEARPGGDKVWIATAYLLVNRVVYLNLDYGDENPERAKRWYRQYDAPSNAQSHLVDNAWSQNGVVMYADRYGTGLHAVDWGGLERSSRVTVSLSGAITTANQFFRGLHARQAESSLEHIMGQVQRWFSRKGPDGFLCKPPPSVELTPGPTACDHPDRRWTGETGPWEQPTWRDLGVNPRALSRHYSYGIEASGEYGSLRMTVYAVGDLDCDQNVATMRVSLTADARASAADCMVREGRWEIINPTD